MIIVKEEVGMEQGRGTGIYCTSAPPTSEEIQTEAGGGRGGGGTATPKNATVAVVDGGE